MLFAQEATPAASAELGVAGLILIGVGAVAWLFFNFTPFLIAWARGHRSTLAIFAVCLFFGWSCIGWVIALIWSLDGNTD